MDVDVTHECAACGVVAVFRLDEERTIWDHGFWPCYTCSGLHYVCRPCLGHLGLAGVPLSDSRLPCFGSDEFRVAAALMQMPRTDFAAASFDEVRNKLVQNIERLLPDWRGCP